MAQQNSSRAFLLIGLLLMAFSAPASVPQQFRTATQMPMLLIENQGQFPSEILFQSLGAERSMQFTRDALWWTILESQPTSQGFSSQNQDRHGLRLRLTFPGASGPSAIEPFARQETQVSYFLGNNPDQWRADVPVWGGLRYREIYPGIDLEISSGDDRTSWQWITREGADIRNLRMRIEGADQVAIESGAAKILTERGYFYLRLPELDSIQYQFVPEVSGTAVHGFEIANAAGHSSGKMSIAGGNTEAQADLLYSALIGAGTEWGVDIKVDAAGNAYVTGNVAGAWNINFPVTPGAFDTTFNGLQDVFVAKLNAGGSALLYATYLGGDSQDESRGIDIDANGAAYVAAYCTTGYPATPGAYATSTGDGFDGACITKLNATGTALVYSTYLRGNNMEAPEDVAVDGAGNAYVLGYTPSTDFPATPVGAGVGNSGFFVVKLNNTGSNLLYSVILGDYRSDTGGGIAVNSSGEAYIAAHSYTGNSGITNGAYDTTHNGSWDVYVAKLNSNGTLAYGTFVGGTGSDYARDIAIDSSGAAYVTGWVLSSNFPTQQAYDSTYNSGGDAFVFKLSPSGAALIYSTYLGGGLLDVGHGIAVDALGAAYITGKAESADFPTTATAYDRVNHGKGDMFAAKLDPSGASLSYSTLIGGTELDEAHAIDVDSIGTAFITGWAGYNFPSTAGAFHSHDNSEDAVVFRLAMSGPVVTTTTTTSATTTTTTSTTTSSSSTTVPTTVPTTTSRPSTTTTVTTSTSTSSTTTTTTTAGSTTTSTTLPPVGAHEMFFPHFAIGGGYRSILTLVNPWPAASSVVVEFFGQDGNMLNPPANGGTLAPYSQAARATASWLIGNTSIPLQVGWCRVTTNRFMGGSLMYQYFRGAELISEASVLPSEKMQRFVMAVPELGGLAATAIAIANPENQAASFTIRFYAANGNLAGGVQRQLGPREQAALFASQIFPLQSPNAYGLLDIETPGAGIVAVGLHFAGDLFSTLPVTPLP
jgi:hypothetical protein